jgi:hypothetical protein
VEPWDHVARAQARVCFMGGLAVASFDVPKRWCFSCQRLTVLGCRTLNRLGVAHAEPPWGAAR